MSDSSPSSSSSPDTTAYVADDIDDATPPAHWWSEAAEELSIVDNRSTVLADIVAAQTTATVAVPDDLYLYAGIDADAKRCDCVRRASDEIQRCTHAAHLQQQLCRLRHIFGCQCAAMAYRLVVVCCSSLIESKYTAACRRHIETTREALGAKEPTPNEDVWARVVAPLLTGIEGAPRGCATLVQWARSRDSGARRAADAAFASLSNMWFLSDTVFRRRVVVAVLSYAANRGHECISSMLRSARTEVNTQIGSAMTKLASLAIADADAECMFDVIDAVMYVHGIDELPPPLVALRRNIRQLLCSAAKTIEQTSELW